MKYNQIHIMKVIKKSDILVVAMGDSKKMIKALPDNRYSVNCFYHSDRKPSMILDRKTNHFYCYSCKKSGNVIKLFMQAYNLDFITSIETLATIFGVKLPSRSYICIHDELVNRLTTIKNSQEYRELVDKSYEKTLKK